MRCLIGGMAERMMKKAFSAIATAIVLMFLPALVPIPESIAQAPQQDRPASKINLTLEQRHVIKEVVKDMPIAKSQTDAMGTSGSSVPSDAVLRFFPPEITEKVPQIKSHRFFVRGNQIVIVSPDSDEIAEIVE
jgi:hypothetical protein